MPDDARPVVYTIRGCDACVKLLRKFEAEQVEYEERRVEQGFGDTIGCFI